MVGGARILAIVMAMFFVTVTAGWAGMEVVLSDGVTVTLSDQDAEAVLGEQGMEYADVVVPLPGGGYLAGTEEDFLAALEAIQTPTPPIFRTLSVTKTGTGQGTVVSVPKGIVCGPDCKDQSYDFRLNTNVTLVPKPAVGSIFGGWWTTSCSGLKPCKVKMDNDKSMQASFMLGTPKITLMPPLPNNQKHFGNTKAGTTKSASFTIKNRGTGFLTVNQIVSTQSGQYTVPPEKDVCSNSEVAPNKTCAFKVYFKPVLNGACGCAGLVEIPSNDPQTPTLSFTLCGCPRP